jgi:predicted dehydrogenase
MERRCGWGILGTGKIAQIIARALRHSAGGRLVAVASRSADRAQEFAARAGLGKHYADYSLLIGDPQVEIVYVATYHPQHWRLAIEAAAAGKHVLCEKPMAMNGQDAAEIIDAARRNDVFFMEAYAYRCHPQTSRLIQMLRAGEIGAVRMVQAAFGYDAGPNPGNYLLARALGGGSILDVGCYPTSIAHMIAATQSDAGAAGAHVTGMAHIGTETGVDHYAAAMLKFPGDLVAMVASAVQVNLDNTLRIYGSAGRITVPSPWLPGRNGAPGSIIIDRLGPSPEVITIETAADVYVLEVDAVCQLVREGHSSHPLMEWQESVANIETLDRWRASIGLSYEDEKGQDAQAGGRVIGVGTGTGRAPRWSPWRT